MEIKSNEGEISMTVQITRKDTGKIEEYHVTGTATPEQAAALRQPVLHEATGALDAQSSAVANQ